MVRDERDHLDLKSKVFIVHKEKLRLRDKG